MAFFSPYIPVECLAILARNTSCPKAKYNISLY
jgi:hypothetical protein